MLKVNVLVAQLVILYEFNPVYSHHKNKMLHLVNTGIPTSPEKFSNIKIHV